MRRPPVLRRGAWLIVALYTATFVHAQTDGARKWAYGTVSTAVPGNILSSPAVAPDGTVYIGVEVGASTSPTPAGRLFALTPAGVEKWMYPTSDWIDSTPAIALDGTIYFGCWDGFLYALNPDGTLKWRRDLGVFVSASPAIGGDGTIYLGAGNGNLYAVSPAGEIKWFFPTLHWIEAAPAIGPDGTIHVGSDDNTFYAVRPDGTEKWHYTTGSEIISSAAIAADGTVYFASRDLKIYALTAEGALKWAYQTADMIEASPVLGADGTVYVPTTGGRLLALNPDGTLKWQYPAAGQAALGSLYSTPAVRADGSLVFGTSDNALYAVSATGTLLWRSTMDDWADSSPVVTADGAIYIGCSDKQVYAFHSTSSAVMTEWPQLLRGPQRTGLQVLGIVNGTQGRLANLSVRTFADRGTNFLSVGFNVAGTGTRNLLVRGVGPTLAAFDLTGLLNDPHIAYIPAGTSTPTLTNDNWEQNGNAAEIGTTAEALGAFPLPAGSRDAALLAPFSAQLGSVAVTGVNDTTGLAMLELYDAGGSAEARLNNVSARSFVGTGAGVLIAGFVVTDNTRAVLVRGVGPALSAWEIPGLLANPRLRIYNAKQSVIAENDDWSSATNATAISAAATAVYAFPLPPGGRDAAVLLTLPPGLYSAVISGVADTTGVGMVEVYEVP